MYPCCEGFSRLSWGLPGLIEGHGVHRGVEHGHCHIPHPLHQLLLNVEFLLTALAECQPPEVGGHAAPQFIQQVLSSDPSGPQLLKNLKFFSLISSWMTDCGLLSTLVVVLASFSLSSGTVPLCNKW